MIDAARSLEPNSATDKSRGAPFGPGGVFIFLFVNSFVSFFISNFSDSNISNSFFQTINYLTLKLIIK